jgi:hypothetical protein
VAGGKNVRAPHEAWIAVDRRGMVPAWVKVTVGSVGRSGGRRTGGCGGPMEAVGPMHPMRRLYYG